MKVGKHRFREEKCILKKLEFSHTNHFHSKSRILRFYVAMLHNLRHDFQLNLACPYFWTKCGVLTSWRELAGPQLLVDDCWEVLL